MPNWYLLTQSRPKYSVGYAYLNPLSTALPAAVCVGVRRHYFLMLKAVLW